MAQLSGHSLGGSVALQLQTDFDQIKGTRTFGAPVYDWGRSIGQELGDRNQGKPDPVVERHKHANEPVSMFDSAAHTVLRKELSDNINPLKTHNYKEMASQFSTTTEVNDTSLKSTDTTFDNGMVYQGTNHTGGVNSTISLTA